MPNNDEKAKARQEKNNAYTRKWRESIHHDPVLRAEQSRKTVAYHQARRAVDPVYAAKSKARAKRYYEKAKADPAKREKMRRHSLESYYRIKASPERQKDYRKKATAYAASRKRIDPEFAMRCHLRVRLSDAVRSLNARKADSALSLVGCTVAELVAHLEHQFSRGMNWENYGRVWHIDHIIPCCKFDLTDLRQQAICFNYLNLQPMFARENMTKNGRLEAHAQMPLGL